MSGIHPETAHRATVQGPFGREIASEITTEITAMNRAFLNLLTDPLAPSGQRVLGLDAAWVDGLRRLSPQHRDELAAAPLLLADFRYSGDGASPRVDFGAEGDVNGVADGDRERDVAPAWQSRVDAFANRLLAALWHFSRQTVPSDNGVAGFCMGLDAYMTRRLSDMSFTELCAQAPEVCSGLRARHAAHPTCWPDLIRLVADGHSEQLNAARLGMIPLTVAIQQTAGMEFAAR